MILWFAFHADILVLALCHFLLLNGASGILWRIGQPHKIKRTFSVSYLACWVPYLRLKKGNGEGRDGVRGERSDLSMQRQLCKYYEGQTPREEHKDLRHQRFKHNCFWNWVSALIIKLLFVANNRNCLSLALAKIIRCYCALRIPFIFILGTLFLTHASFVSQVQRKASLVRIFQF